MLISKKHGHNIIHTKKGVCLALLFLLSINAIVSPMLPYTVAAQDDIWDISSGEENEMAEESLLDSGSFEDLSGSQPEQVWKDTYLSSEDSSSATLFSEDIIAGADSGPFFSLSDGSSSGEEETVYAANYSTVEDRQRFSLGPNYTAVLAKDNSLWMWGANGAGQIGNGHTTDVLEPVKVMENVRSVSLGLGNTSAAILNDGSLWMWGQNNFGQAGDGTKTNILTPVRIMDNVACVVPGMTHSAAIQNDGTLWLWGSNDFGQMGTSDTSGVLEPHPVMTNVRSVTLGYFCTMVIKTDGSLWASGTNSVGYGIGRSLWQTSSFTKIMDNVEKVTLSAYHGAVIKTDGSLWVWGKNTNGQLGTGDDTSQQWNAVKVMDYVIDVALGETFTAAISGGWKLWMWGGNSEGEIACGPDVQMMTRPREIMQNVRSIRTGYQHGAAVKADGALYLWGKNSFGQLGNGGTASSYTEEKRMAIIEPVSSVPSFEEYNANARIFGLENSGNGLYPLLLGFSTGNKMAYQRLAEAIMEDTTLYYSSGVWLGTFDNMLLIDPEYAYLNILRDFLGFDPKENVSLQNTLQNSTIDFAFALLNELIDIAGELPTDGEGTLKKAIDDLSNLPGEQAYELMDYTGMKIMRDLAYVGDFMYGTGMDVINRMAQYMAVRDQLESYINFLRQVSTAATENEPLQKALAIMTEVYGDESPAGLLASLNYDADPASWKLFCDVVKDASSKTVEIVGKILGSEAAILFAEAELTAKGLNVLFGTTQQSKDLMSMLALYTIDSYFRMALFAARESYTNTPCEESARNFNRAFDLYASWQIYATQHTKQHVYNIAYGGALTALWADQAVVDEWLTLCDQQIDTRRRILGFTERYRAIYDGLYNRTNEESTVQSSSEVPISGISVGQANVRTGLLDGPFSLNASVLPENASNPGLEYASTNKNIVTIDENGECTPQGVGSAIVIAQTVEGGYSASVYITVVEGHMEEPDYTYTLLGSEMRIDRYVGDDVSVVIPATIGGYPVACIGKRAFYRDGGSPVRHVVIPENASSIEEEAFYGCEALETVYIPAGVLSISSSAFEQTSPLLLLDIACASFACEWAKSQTVSYVLRDHNWHEPCYEWAEDNAVVTAKRLCPGCGMEEYEEAAADEKVQKSPTFEDDGIVAYMGGRFENPAFTIQEKTMVIPKLDTTETLVLPRGTVQVEEEAFSNGRFKAVIIPEDCVGIGEKAFAGCENLSYVQIRGDADIAEDAFDDDTNIVFDYVQK